MLAALPNDVQRNPLPEVPNTIPLPVAQLLVRAHNDKDLGTAYENLRNAWEVSFIVRAACSRLPLEHQRLLGTGTLGDACRACVADIPDERVSAPACIDLWTLLQSDAPKRAPTKLTLRDFLQTIPSWRNDKDHGGARWESYLLEAVPAHYRALVELWTLPTFWSEGTELVSVGDINHSRGDNRRAELFRLMGPTFFRERHHTNVTGDVEPGQCYVRRDNELHPTGPWIQFEPDGMLGSVWIARGSARGRPKFINYVTAESLKGSKAAERFPTAVVALVQIGAERSSRQDDDASRQEPALIFKGIIGRGGMGEIREAVQTSLHRRVAVKTIPLDLADRGKLKLRLEREVAVLSQCEHPNVVRVYERGEHEDGRPWFSMEYVDGVDLSRLLGTGAEASDLSSAISLARRSKGSGLGSSVPVISRVLQRDLAVLMRDAAGALQYLHGLGFVHRDIKPGNLMVTAHDQRIVVLDFGLVRDDTKTALTSESVVGTLSYMAPELMIDGERTATAAADVYGLGATFYHLLTGSQVVIGPNGPRRPRELNPELDPDLAAVIEHSLDPEPGRRYRSAASLAQALTAILDGSRSVSAAEVSYRVGRLVRSYRAGLAAGGTLIVASAMAGLLYAKDLERRAQELDAARARAEEARMVCDGERDAADAARAEAVAARAETEEALEDAEAKQRDNDELLAKLRRNRDNHQQLQLLLKRERDLDRREVRSGLPASCKPGSPDPICGF